MMGDFFLEGCSRMSLGSMTSTLPFCLACGLVSGWGLRTSVMMCSNEWAWSQELCDALGAHYPLTASRSQGLVVSWVSGFAYVKVFRVV